MKLNRIASFAVITLAMLLILSQGLSGGAKAAPTAQAQLSAHFVATAGDQSKTQSPNDQTPYHMTVQGRLTNSIGNPITVATNVTFRLYDAPVGGTIHYTETNTITPDANGLFTYQLGSNANLGSIIYYIQSKLYLGITVGNDAEMTPRFELTAATYAMALAPGAMAKGPFSGPNPGAVNGMNTDYSQYTNAGLYGNGAAGILGISDSVNGIGMSEGGIFLNNNAADNHDHFGIYARTIAGIGLYAESGAVNNQQQSVGVSGYSGAVNGIGVVGSGFSGIGGVFTGTLGVVGYVGGDGSDLSGHNDAVSGYSISNTGDGIYGHATGTSGYGVWGTALGGDSSAIGGVFMSYDNNSSHLGLQVNGQGHATGGFSTGLDYGMMVKYDGSEALQPGDVLALDGNNQTVAGNDVFGVVKANTSNASAAIGVARYRYNIFTPVNKPPSAQVDDKTTTFHSGDLIEVVVLGRAQMKVNGAVSIGDRLGLTSDGSVAATKGSSDSVGKVASTPDKDGYVTVFVNLK